MDTKVITAAKLTTNHVLVSATGKLGFISRIGRNGGMTVITRNGETVAMKDERPVRVRMTDADYRRAEVELDRRDVL